MGVDCIFIARARDEDEADQWLRTILLASTTESFPGFDAQSSESSRSVAYDDVWGWFRFRPSNFAYCRMERVGSQVEIHDGCRIHLNPHYQRAMIAWVNRVLGIETCGVIGDDVEDRIAQPLERRPL